MRINKHEKTKSARNQTTRKTKNTGNTYETIKQQEKLKVHKILT